MGESRDEAGMTTPRKPMPDHAHGVVNDTAERIQDEVYRLRKELPHLDTHSQTIAWQTIANLTDCLRLLESIGAQTKP